MMVLVHIWYGDIYWSKVFSSNIGTYAIDLESRSQTFLLRYFLETIAFNTYDGLRQYTCMA